MKIYLVATPIGNLGDITLRALEVLKAAPLIACEDTRVSLKLLNHYGIKTRLISCHQHTSPEKLQIIFDVLVKTGEMAVITDAGTPGISDPGNLLIEAALKRFGAKCEIIPIPGTSALTSALSVAGLPTDKFIFLGFLPHKKGRETIFKTIASAEETIVFYESTHRIIKTLEKLATVLAGDRRLVVAREITKKFESIYRGNAREILRQVLADSAKGEFVVMVDRKR